VTEVEGDKLELVEVSQELGRVGVKLGEAGKAKSGKSKSQGLATNEVSTGV